MRWRSTTQVGPACQGTYRFTSRRGVEQSYEQARLPCSPPAIDRGPFVLFQNQPLRSPCWPIPQQQSHDEVYLSPQRHLRDPILHGNRLRTVQPRPNWHNLRWPCTKQPIRVQLHLPMASEAIQILQPAPEAHNGVHGCPRTEKRQ